ncbi:MAG TPA: hypothetical protein VMB71_08940, partial [Acetobacteraceae bacterium]|nr:hypothetical protein [Acetobacteraceae bacterium]
MQDIQHIKLLKTCVVGILLAGLSMMGTAQAAPRARSVEARLAAAWRAAITGVAVPGQGCFTAEYPSTAWVRVACTKAPPGPFLPAHGPRGFVVGNGNDYAAETATPISSAV